MFSDHGRLLFEKEGGGGGGEGGEDKIGPLTQQVEKLTKATEGLIARNQQLESMFVSQEYLEFIEDKSKGTKRVDAKGDAGSVGELDDEAINRMSNAQLLKIVTKAVENTLDEKLKHSVEPRLAQQELKEATDDVRVAAGKYEDFWDHKEVMLRISAQHPTLGAEDLYLHAVRKAGQEVKLRGSGEGEKPPPKKPAAPARAEGPSIPPRAREKVLARKPGESGMDAALDQAYKEAGLEE